MSISLFLRANSDWNLDAPLSSTSCRFGLYGKIICMLEREMRLFFARYNLNLLSLSSITTLLMIFPVVITEIWSCSLLIITLISSSTRSLE